MVGVRNGNTVRVRVRVRVGVRNGNTVRFAVMATVMATVRAIILNN